MTRKQVARYAQECRKAYAKGLAKPTPEEAGIFVQNITIDSLNKTNKKIISKMTVSQAVITDQLLYVLDWLGEFTKKYPEAAPILKILDTATNESFIVQEYIKKISL